MARDPEITHKIMASIKSRDTVPELMLRKALWHKGFRYRVNDRTIYGKPDISFTRVKLAVFCDGDYWHGHNWALRGYIDLEDELSNYKSFWADKIRKNIQRDEEVNARLFEDGWSVLRIWESDIINKLGDQVNKITDAYFKLNEKF